MGNINDTLAGAAVGWAANEAITRSTSFISNRFNSRADVDDKLDRLGSLTLKIRSAANLADPEVFNGEPLVLQWRDKLRHEVEEGTAVLHSFKRQSGLSNPGFKSGLKRLISSDAEMEKLDRVICRLEKADSDVGVFLATVERIAVQTNKRRRLRRCSGRLPDTRYDHELRELCIAGTNHVKNYIEVFKVLVWKGNVGVDQSPALLEISVKYLSKRMRLKQAARNASERYRKQLETASPATVCSRCDADDDGECCIYLALCNMIKENEKLLQDLLSKMWEFDCKLSSSQERRLLLPGEGSSGSSSSRNLAADKQKRVNSLLLRMTLARLQHQV